MPTVEERLDKLTSIIGSIIPAVQIGFTAYKLAKEAFTRSGGDIGTFQEEDVRLTEARNTVGAAIAEFHATFGTGGSGPGEIVPPSPEGPPPGGTTVIGG